MKYIDIIKENRQLEKSLSGEKYRIAIITNITVNQIKEILEFDLRSKGIFAEVTFGDYDNIVQDSIRFSDADLVIIFWEIANLIDGLEEKCYLMDSKQLDTLSSRFENDINLVIKNLKSVPLVIVNKFTNSAFDSFVLSDSPLIKLSKQGNLMLEKLSSNNVIAVNLEKIFNKLSIDNSIDTRQFQSSKALYSINFFKTYVNAINPAIMSIKGFSKKILVLDCDNTLWDGIVGEDGLSGLQMSDLTPKGKVFSEVQKVILGLKNSGILLAICSKNNEKDVLEVFDKHKDILLSENDFAAIKINWKLKAENIKEIANDLNIGLESFVFVDDSDFEVSLVQQSLPQVHCLKVPKNLSDYKDSINKLRGLFFTLSNSDEDKVKTDFYLQEKIRKQHSVKFASLESYIASLELQIFIDWNNRSSIPRAAQLTQKTNQFNLTTKRYSEEQLIDMLDNKHFEFATFSATDLFGEYGITGLIILKPQSHSSNVYEIDNLLMSCRVLGRNIEFKFINEVLNKLKRNGIKKLYATYLRSNKNEQVECFFEKVQFNLIEKNNNCKNYELIMKEFKYKNLEYIKCSEII